MEGWGSAFPARHRKASSEAEPLQPEGTSLEVIPHHVSQSGVSVERVANLGVGGGGEVGVSIFLISSTAIHRHSISQHFFGWWTMHRARKGPLGLSYPVPGGGRTESCAGCVEGGKRGWC